MPPRPMVGFDDLVMRIPAGRLYCDACDNGRPCCNVACPYRPQVTCTSLSEGEGSYPWTGGIGARMETDEVRARRASALSTLAEIDGEHL